MRRALLLAACAMMIATGAHADVFSNSGYPKQGRAIDTLKPAADYTDLAVGRPRALGIIRARAQGFVPSPELHDYIKGVLDRVLAGETLPPSFHADVRVLAAPEFTALCTPDGTIVVTVGLLELLENEDELAFILAHEASHAILRHHDSDWMKQSEYFAVANGAAVDDIAKNVSFRIGGFDTAYIAGGYHAMKSIYNLSANVLAPQYQQGQEDQADALGFDLMVKAGYDPAAALSVMDKLAAQEEIADAAAKAAKDAGETKEKEEKKHRKRSMGGFGFNIGGLKLGEQAGTASGLPGWASLALAVFDKAVNAMADEAVSHHPATERMELLANYQFREYRDLTPRTPHPVGWSPDSTARGSAAMVALLSHYGSAEDAASYVADTRAGQTRNDEAQAQTALQRSTQSPTADHAYTQFAAAEFYDLSKNDPAQEKALIAAASGPEPSWEVYSRLTDIYLARKDYTNASAMMDKAVVRFDNSPVILPKRIEVLTAQGKTKDAEALLPQCKGYDLDTLTEQCRKAAGEDE